MVEAAQAGPFVMFDRVLVHKGDSRLYEDWDFLCDMDEEADIPLNWLEPVNYAQGSVHVRLEVREMKETESEVGFGIGWTNLPRDRDPTGQHCCTWPARFRAPGVYEGGRPLPGIGHWPAREKDPVLDWDWSHAFHKGSMFTLMQPKGQDPFPVTFRVTLTVLPKEA